VGLVGGFWGGGRLGCTPQGPFRGPAGTRAFLGGGGKAGKRPIGEQGRGGDPPPFWERGGRFNGVPGVAPAGPFSPEGGGDGPPATGGRQAGPINPRQGWN